MLQLIINVLSPILIPMGVSQADLESYVNMCGTYIYALIIALVVLIVILIAAHWLAKKGNRHVIRWTAVLAFIAAVTIIANQVVFGPLKNNLAMQFAPKVELSAETVSGSTDAIQKIGEEGIVLLKNDGLLPLSSDVTSLNVFGYDSAFTIFGGTGSGSSVDTSNIGIIKSLQDAGYATNETLTKLYTDYSLTRGTISMSEQNWTLPEPTKDAYTSDIMSEATAFSNVAVICIGRSGGEGADLPTDMGAVIDGTYNVASTIIKKARNNYGYTNASYTNNGDYNDFEAGETYLELSKTEEDLVDLVCSNFDNVIVVINANNAMELGWVDEYEQIKAVLYAPGSGVSGMEGLGEILNGSVNPSGRTADTFVKDLTATPTFNNIGHNAFTNDEVTDLEKDIASADAAYQGSMSFVNYVEGIYVGYKYYETASDDGVIDYDAAVQYPFGYGLSYTTFSQEITAFEKTDDSVHVEVTVTNTGSVAGKDVVELYYTPPYNNGGIEKASVNLVDFAKTAVLEAGATEIVSFDVALEDIASYDSECIKTANGGYILEAGEYTFSVRSDSHTVLDSESFTLDADIDYSETGRSSDATVATNQFEEYSAGNVTYLSRKDGFANYAEVTAAPAEEMYTMDDATFEAVKAVSSAYYDASLYDDASDEMPVTGASNGLQLADLTGKSYDDESWDLLIQEMTTDELVTLVNLGGWQTAAIDSIGKVATADCDGPAGLNNWLTGNYGTSFPTEILMAQTWNKELLYQMGQVMGAEYAAANNYGWYGPAMNIHRSAFAGRNFEYYSEDGTLSGLLAAEEVRGAAENGVYAYIKHFALNDQETDRCSFLLTYSNEQAIREIYLKPFETVIKSYDTSKAGLAVMSSFNFIGTKMSCANSNLLINVLRNEWGFEGMVITDYNGSYGYMSTENCIRNGNDLMLGFGTAATNAVDTTSATAVKALQNAAHNILYTIGNSGYYGRTYSSDASATAHVSTDTNAGLTNMTALFNKINMAVAAVLIIIEALVLILWITKKKKKAEA